MATNKVKFEADIDEKTANKIKSELSSCCDSKDWKKNSGAAGGGAVYGIGLIGALIYFISNAGNFWNGVLGILKALVWPAMLVYYLFDFLKIG